MNSFTLLLSLHIGAGVLALATVGIPLVAKKGATLHRRVGWVYVAAMTVVSASALGLAAVRLFNESASDDLIGHFLGQVALLTADNVYGGIRATRRRKAPGQVAGLLGLDYSVCVGLLLASLGLAVLAFTHRSVLLAGFTLLGLVSALSDLNYLWRGQGVPRAWFFRHLSSMIGSGIATITAVLVVNAPRLHLGTFSIALWLGPALVGNVAIFAWTRYYRGRFARTQRAPSPAAGPNSSGALEALI